MLIYLFFHIPKHNRIDTFRFYLFSKFEKNLIIIFLQLKKFENLFRAYIDIARIEILESASGFIKYLEIFEIDIESGKSSPHKYMGIQSD